MSGPDQNDEDKGHGIWITFLVQLGILGLVAFLAPAAYALIRGIGRGDALSGPIVLAMIAYLLGSLTNDSTVGVTPIFCVLAGLAAGPRRRAGMEFGDGTHNEK